jgi:hypothetical protein
MHACHVSCHAQLRTSRACAYTDAGCAEFFIDSMQLLMSFQECILQLNSCWKSVLQSNEIRNEAFSFLPGRPCCMWSSFRSVLDSAQYTSCNCMAAYSEHGQKGLYVWELRECGICIARMHFKVKDRVEWQTEHIMWKVQQCKAGRLTLCLRAWLDDDLEAWGTGSGADEQWPFT